MPETPHVKSFLIADSVFQQTSGKWCIIGVFGRIEAEAFPCVHPSLGLYVKLADARGTFEVTVEFQDSTGQVLARLTGLRVESKDPLAEPEFGVQVQQLPIPTAGAYFFKLYFDDRLCPDDIRLTARQTKPAPQS